MAIDPQIANVGWNAFAAGQQLAQQRSRSRLQDMYLGQQMQHGAAQEQRAQETHGMRQEQFTREQTEAEARRLHSVFNDFLGPWAQGALAAGDEAAQRKYVADSLRNPAFRQRLQQADLYDNIDDIDPNDPDLLGELQMLAGAVKPAGSTGVHSAYQAEDGSLVYLNRDGKVVKTDTQIQKFAPQVVGVGGGLEWANPNTQETTTGGAVATPQQQIGAEAAKAAAVTGAQTTARTSAELQAEAQKKGYNAMGVLDMLDRADPLIEVATGSTAGAARDAVIGFFGGSGTGDQAIAELQVLQAGLMLAMPRMEGPQSDRDVQLYREAAGQIGDPSVPRARKQAAVRTIRAIQQRYAERGGATSGDRGGAGGGGQPQAGEITATGPNGRRIVLRNGKWVPLK